MLNVCEFGAKGDGRVDDTAAIQRALDAAVETRATVFFPEGTYCTGMLRTHDYIGLQGNPTWSYYIAGGTILKLIDPDAPCLLNMEYCRGVRVNGLCLEGDYLGQAHGIWMAMEKKREREDFPAIERTMVAHFAGHGIRMDDIWCFSLRGCAIGANRGDGVLMSGADGYILDTWISGNHGAGLRAQEGTGSTTITANRIEWNRQGGLVISAAWNYNITGNCIDRASGPGISLIPNPQTRLSCYHFAVTGNTILRSGNLRGGEAMSEYERANVYLEECGGLVFTGNTLTAGQNDANSKDPGAGSPDYGIVANGLIDSVVRDNVMFRGALKQLVVDLGEHQNSIIGDNPGSLMPVTQLREKE